MTNQSQINNTEEEVSIKELFLNIREWLNYLLSKWLIILIIGILGGVLGFIYANSKKTIFTANTTFVLEEGGSSSSALGNLGGLASMAGIDLGGGGGGLFQGDNILELYKSRTMIEKTLFSEVNIQDKKGLLINRYIEFNKIRENWSDKPVLKNIQFSLIDLDLMNNHRADRLKDSIIGAIVMDVKNNYLNVIKPDKKLSIIKVEVKAKDEFFAKAFNDQIVKNVNDFYVQTKTKKATKNVAILNKKTDSVRSVMNGSIYTAAAITDATPNLNPTRQIQRVAPVQRSQFSIETNKAILSELLKNLEMSKMSLLQQTPLIQVVDYPIYPLEKEQFSRAKGVIIGIFLSSFICVLILLIKKYFRDLLK